MTDLLILAAAAYLAHEIGYFRGYRRRLDEELQAILQRHNLPSHWSLHDFTQHILREEKERRN